MLNGDLNARAAVHSDTLDWVASPSGSVWRRRLHHVGPAESGQVTSIVRYESGSAFPLHEHPDGEEIFVLEGVFSDDAGDWPAGTFLLNPDGFSHAPGSVEGCLLFVKLRQYPGLDRQYVALQTDGLQWTPGAAPGIEIRQLYRQAGYTDTMRLERWTAGSVVAHGPNPDGLEIFVLDGSLVEQGERFERHDWLRLPPGTDLSAASDSGCVLYVKAGGNPNLSPG